MSVARGPSALYLLRSRLLRCAVGGVGGAVLLAGCTSNAEPRPLPEPTASAAVSASPSPAATPPTLPAAAEGTSPRAAKAFARHYFDVVNYAARTGDTKDLRSLAAPGCVSCEAIASNIERIYNAGGHIESDGWTLQQARSLKTTSTRSILTLGVRLESEVVVTGEGDKQHHAGRLQPMTMHLMRDAGGFSVARLDLVT
jgi:hypothetical protein